MEISTPNGRIRRKDEEKGTVEMTTGSAIHHPLEEALGCAERDTAATEPEAAVLFNTAETKTKNTYKMYVKR